MEGPGLPGSSIERPFANTILRRSHSEPGCLHYLTHVTSDEPGAARPVTDGVLEGRAPAASSDYGQRSGIRRARRSGRIVPACGARRNTWRADGFVQRQNHRPYSGADAGFGLRKTDLAAGAADAERTTMARAGRIHQPRTGADLRYPARAPESIPAADCRRPPCPAHRRTL